MSEELLVVGAGPAGMAAALAAHRLGATVTVLDENTRPGGQIYRQPLTAEALSARGSDPKARAGQAMVDAFTEAGIRYVPETVCWGASPPRRVQVFTEGPGTRDIHARSVILATGAYERPVPFPGWTLPGVMTAGGAQVFLKSQGIVPGRRFLLAGSGPLQFALAAQLVKAGARVEAVVDVTRPWSRQTLAGLPGLAAYPAVIREAAGLIKTLTRARVPVIWGAGMRRALGTTQVEVAEIGGVDGDWRPTGDRVRRFTVDTVCLGYGFVPSTELATLLRCELRHDLFAGGWVPSKAETMETSQELVYAAGDGSGIGGSVVAELEGEIAGISAALRLGYGRGDEEVLLRRAKLQATLRRMRRFTRALGRVMTPKEGVGEWLTGETVVCRCEEVRDSDIRAAIDQGACGLRGVKLRTRAGMGLCQARMCAPAIAAAYGEAFGGGPAAPPRPQIPIKPVGGHVLL
ncbi:FAD-dependent oxidoreductase [Amycolatopsis sp. K13G38]|uniref:FAD-dependent oxidoreductase n=1 Tax=Amycolatopsis acididurans TaxID=2724524 RepID=A0ABX1JGN1_9PSEU|nr:NAD(P)/FAD-dependent oxidoreductase [Amycolatopsis acididurans]NKQ57706.1 FAD-dependent oxidoreductase [Amycolatopsis acididurans]